MYNTILWNNLNKEDNDLRNYVFNNRIFSNVISSNTDGYSTNYRINIKFISSVYLKDCIEHTQQEVLEIIRKNTNYSILNDCTNITFKEYNNESVYDVILNLELCYNLWHNLDLIKEVTAILKVDNELWKPLYFAHYFMSILEINSNINDTYISIIPLDIATYIYKGLEYDQVINILGYNSYINSVNIPFAIGPYYTRSGKMKSNILLDSNETRERLELAMGISLDNFDKSIYKQYFAITGSLVAASMCRSPIECCMPKTKPPNVSDSVHVKHYQWINYLNYMYPSFDSYDINYNSTKTTCKFYTKPNKVIYNNIATPRGYTQYTYKQKYNTYISDIDIPIFTDNDKLSDTIMENVVDIVTDCNSYRKEYISKKINSKRIHIYGKSRPFEIYAKGNTNIESIITTHHMPNIRACYYMGKFYLSYECLVALKTNINSTYSWFLGSCKEESVILKNIQRGYSIMLNDLETSDIYTYINKTPNTTDDIDLISDLTFNVSIDSNKFNKKYSRHLNNMLSSITKSNEEINIWNIGKCVNSTYSYKDLFIEDGKFNKLGNAYLHNIPCPPADKFDKIRKLKLPTYSQDKNSIEYYIRKIQSNADIEQESVPEPASES